MPESPNPLNYRPRPAGPEHKPGSVPMFIAGVAAGLGLSFVGWSIGLRSGGGGALLLAILLLIIVKTALGLLVDGKSERRGFFPGILLSIALVPLVALGTLAVLCGGFRLN